VNPRLILVWHEAGNRLYHDRFRELAKVFDLTVVGPEIFAGVDYRPGARADLGFDLKLFPSRASGHWLSYFSPAMMRYIRANPPEVLYVHEEPHSVTAFWAALLKRKSTLVLESSAINLKGNFGGANLLERLVYARVDKIFPKNTEVAGVLAQRGASKAKILAPLGNGVSLQSFSPTPRPRRASNWRKPSPRCGAPSMAACWWALPGASGGPRGWKLAQARVTPMWR
jgi:hypothetical protein